MNVWGKFVSGVRVTIDGVGRWVDDIRRSLKERLHIHVIPGHKLRNSR